MPSTQQHEARIALKGRVCKDQMLLIRFASRPGVTDTEWFRRLVWTALALRFTLEHWPRKLADEASEEYMKHIEILVERGIEPLRGWLTDFIGEWDIAVADGKCGLRTCVLCRQN